MHRQFSDANEVCTVPLIFNRNRENKDVTLSQFPHQARLNQVINVLTDEKEALTYIELQTVVGTLCYPRGTYFRLIPQRAVLCYPGIEKALL